MKYSQAQELWNTIAQKKNLSIHHGIKVINGWNKIPALNKGNYSSLVIVRDFLQNWLNAIQSEIDLIENIKNDEFNLCECGEGVLEEDEYISKSEFPNLNSGLHSGREIYRCARCQNYKVSK